MTSRLTATLRRARRLALRPRETLGRLGVLDAEPDVGVMRLGRRRQSQDGVAGGRARAAEPDMVVFAWAEVEERLALDPPRLPAIPRSGRRRDNRHSAARGGGPHAALNLRGELPPRLKPLSQTNGLEGSMMTQAGGRRHV